MTRYTMLTAIAVSAFAFSATAETCLETADRCFDFQDVKWETVGGLSDAYYNYGKATHELHQRTHEHWNLYFDSVMAVAGAKDEQWKSGSEEPDFRKLGKFLWDRNDALRAAEDAMNDARAKVHDAHMVLMDAQLASQPYLNKYGSETGMIVELIQCVLDGSRN